MKKRIFVTLLCALCFFGALTVFAITTSAQTTEIRDSVFRFHVIANSDSDADQKNKLAVRDGIATLCSELFSQCQNKMQSMEIANASLEKIEKCATQILRERGDKSEVKASVTKRFFPTRHYDGVSLPAGVYDTLDIKIGNALGKNFWCVMFPDICLGASTDADNKQKMSTVLSQGSLDFVTDQKSPSVKLKFKSVELFYSIKRFVSKQFCQND